MCPAALLSDVKLHGEVSSTPAAWVTSPSGQHLSVVWPNGYVARFAPQLQIIDGSGHVVAQEGDTLDLTGGEVDPRFDWFACHIDNQSSP
jgi:hypothetical protein